IVGPPVRVPGVHERGGSITLETTSEPDEHRPTIDPEQPYGVRDDQRSHSLEDADRPLRPRGPIMRALHGYRMLADRLAGALGAVSAVLIFPTVIISIVNVVLRRVGANQGRNLTSNALIEAQWYLYTLIFVFGLAYILKNSVNVRVDFWFGNLSSRTQSWIDLIGHFIGLLPFAYIGIKYSWPSVQLSWEAREGSPDAGGLPRYPIKTALMAGFVFLAVQAIAEVIKNIEYLRGHERRYASAAPALAAGQEYAVDDFAVSTSGGRS
ncbi:MAG: TRAP transporter small permease subunit, partial [Ilumatobacteraceae bacterium]